MHHCTSCFKTRYWTSTGKFVDERRQWQCRNCGNIQLEERPQGLKIPPKILYIDIETALMSVYLYDLRVYSGYVNKEFIKEHSYVINWAAAWLDESYEIKGRIMSGVCKPEEAKERNDERILGTIWKLMDQADYVCGHNSFAFDVKRLNWRFMVHKMGFPYKFEQVDSFKMAGKYAKAPSRGLEFLALMFGGEKKKGLTRDEWIAIIDKETEEKERARLLRKSNRYCRGDVNEGVLVLREFAKAVEGAGYDVLKWNKQPRKTKREVIAAIDEVREAQE